jgi:hypothetical protein
MDNVYRKTERGLAEIATRQYKLAPRLRSALVVVDGKRSDLELASMIAGEPQETLQALLEAGFIELAGDAQAGPAVLAAPAGPVERPPRPPEPVAAAAPLASAAPEVPAVAALAVDDAAAPEEATGYAPTQPLDDLGEIAGPAAAAAAAAAKARAAARPAPATTVARTLETTKRHAMQWLTEHLGSYADHTNRRIERCESSESLSSAILVARAVVEQQLGAETARRFESEMFAALRRGAVA